MSYPPPSDPPGWPPPPGAGPPPNVVSSQPGYQPGPGWPMVREHPQGTTVLILGILSLVLCQLLGPVAWAMGSSALREIDRSPGSYTNRGTVQAGRICGIIASSVIIIAIGGVLAALLVFALNPEPTTGS